MEFMHLHFPFDVFKIPNSLISFMEKECGHTKKSATVIRILVILTLFQNLILK